MYTSDNDLWKNIWNKKKITKISDDLQFLIEFDGFDGGCGAMNAEIWNDYVQRILKKVEYGTNMNVLEVGCGCGAFLKCLNPDPNQVVGIDYSENHIELAKKVFPENYQFYCMEAAEIGKIEEKFHLVVSNSVFHYFPNLEYAEDVIQKMINLTKPGGHIAILDIVNSDNIEEIKQQRINELGEKKYQELYGNMKHLSFYKDEIVKILEKIENITFTIEDQSIENYQNARYRYNLFIKKSSY